MPELIKRHKKRIYLVIGIVVLGIPFLIHCLFKFYLHDFFVAEWSAGDLLSYFGATIFGVITIYLAYIAVKQTQVANDTNNRLLKLDEMERKVLLKLNLSLSEVMVEDNMKIITVHFENITEILISEFHVETSEKLLLGTNWPFNQENKAGIVVNEYLSMAGEALINDKKTFTYTLVIKNYESPFLLITFKSISKSIYGLKSIQNYNIMLQNKVFTGYLTSLEEDL